jgi:hypothetical protein
MLRVRHAAGVPQQQRWVDNRTANRVHCFRRNRDVGPAVGQCFGSDPRAEKLQWSDARSSCPPTATLQADGLMVSRSLARRPLYLEAGARRQMVRVLAGVTARNGSTGQPTGDGKIKRTDVRASPGSVSVCLHIEFCTSPHQKTASLQGVLPAPPTVLPFPSR